MAGFLEASSARVTLHSQGSSTRPSANAASHILVAPEQRVSGIGKAGRPKLLGETSLTAHLQVDASARPCHLSDQQGGGGRSCRLTVVPTWALETPPR